MTANTTAAPATATELYIVLNEQTGDDVYADSYTIPSGDFVNLYKLSNWVGKELDITASNIVTTFSSISVGDELTFDATTFKFKKGTGTAGDLVYIVKKIFGAGVNGVIAEIKVKPSA